MSPDITYYTFDSPSTTVSVHYCLATTESYTPLKRGDRVRIREGYDGAGAVGFYESKSNDTEGVVLVVFGDNIENTLLAAAIEPYPYSREERIERAIQDFEETVSMRPCPESPECNCYMTLDDDDRALLFAILDAGV